MTALSRKHEQLAIDLARVLGVTPENLPPVFQPIGRVRPFEIGILGAIMERHPQASRRGVQLILRRWVNAGIYQRLLSQRHWRYSIDDVQTEPIMPKMRARAKLTIAEASRC